MQIFCVLFCCHTIRQTSKKCCNSHQQPSAKACYDISIYFTTSAWCLQAPQHLRSETSQNLPAQTESHSSPIRCHPADGRVETDGEKISLFKATSRLCLDPQLHWALSNLIKRLGFVRPACSSEFILLLKTVANLLLVQVCHTTGHSRALFLLLFLSVYLADGNFSTVTAPPSLWPFLCSFLFSYFYTIDEFMLSVTQFRFFFQCVQKNTNLKMFVMS